MKQYWVSQDEIDMLNEMRSLPPEHRERLLEVISLMAKCTTDNKRLPDNVVQLRPH